MFAATTFCVFLLALNDQSTAKPVTQFEPITLFGQITGDDGQPLAGIEVHTRAIAGGGVANDYELADTSDENGHYFVTAAVPTFVSIRQDGYLYHSLPNIDHRFRERFDQPVNVTLTRACRSV